MSYDTASNEVEAKLKEFSTTVDRLMGEVGRRIVGQKHIVERLMIALVCEGHVLIEGLPGLAKTSIIKALSEITSLKFSRIQFTPDLLPADVIGTQIYDPKGGEFRVKKGPVFSNLLLADEINRSPAKVQSALLEAMQERQVTIGDETFSLQRPFLVMATQNPIEQEGTYPLPEAQVDRFLFKLKMDYPTIEEEQIIVARIATGEEVALESMVSRSDLIEMAGLVGKVHVSDKVRKYIVDLVFATRNPSDFGLKDIAELIDIGASPRASINLERAARAQAMLQGRAFITPQDVKDVGMDVLRHRIIPTYEAEAENVTTDDIIQKIFDRIDVP